MRYAVTCLLSIVLLSGCASNMSGISLDNSNQYVVLGNEIPENALKVEDVTARKSGEYLAAQVAITNQMTQPLDLEYRFIWYGAQGLQINYDDQQWQTLTLPAGVQVVLQGKASSSQAQVFRVAIKKGSESSE